MNYKELVMLMVESLDEVQEEEFLRILFTLVSRHIREKKK